MANYLMTNVAINVATDKDGAKHYYLTADLENKRSIDEEAGGIVLNEFRGKRRMEKIRHYISKEKNGYADVDTDIPEELLTFEDAFFVEVPFDEPHVLCYAKDENGYKAGEPRKNKDGQFYVKNSFNAFCIRNPEGFDASTRWLKGYTPSDAKAAVTRTLFKQLKQFVTTAEVVEEAPMPE